MGLLALRSVLVLTLVAGCIAPTVISGSPGTPDANDASTPVDARVADVRVADVPPTQDVLLRCEPGQALCSGRCVDSSLDPSNCGGCLRACASGASCRAGECGAPPSSGRPFRVARLLPSGCTSVDHSSVTGDDRGGIALSGSSLFYNGDDSIGRFDADTLEATPVGRVDDGLFSDLATGQVYSLQSRGVPVTLGSRGSITELGMLDGRSGALLPSRVGNLVRLTPAIPLGGGVVGIFSGYGRAVIYDSSRAYNIDLPSGFVTDLGGVAAPLRAAPCDAPGFWGIAEFFEGAISVVYAGDSQRVLRTLLPGGQTSTIELFANLGDMCSLTVDPTRNRWYWHNEGTSQFGEGGERVGYCDATFLP